MLDFLIVGGGLAGSTVAFKLQQKGAKIVQIADVSRPTSSQVAGGMFNPITGKYLTKTWLAEDLYAALFVHYKDIEDRFQASFFFPIGVKRLFNNPENKAHFLGQIVKNNLQDWVEEIPASTRYLQGGLMIKQSGWVNVDAYVHTLRSYFIDLGIFSNQQFDYSALEIHPDFVTYKGIKAQKPYQEWIF